MARGCGTRPRRRFFGHVVTNLCRDKAEVCWESQVAVKRAMHLSVAHITGLSAQERVGDSTTKWIAGRINEWFGLKSAIRDW
jgi:hypothetical protein